MIKLKTLLLLTFALFAIGINAQIPLKYEDMAHGFFEDFDVIFGKKSVDKDIYFETLRDVVRMPGDDDKVNLFFNRMEIDTSTVYLKLSELQNLYSYATALLEMQTRFQRANYQEIGQMNMMKHLVAHDYDSIYGFALYYFDQVRQLPSEEKMLFWDESMEKYKNSIALYQADRKGLIEIALSCLEHGARFPLFAGMGEYSGINFSEHGWFGDDETILCFYKHIYKKDDSIENEKWELLSPGAILLENVSNPFLSEATFKALINLMPDDEKSSFPQAVFALDPSYTRNQPSYEFLQMLFNYFPTASINAGYNKLHLAIMNLDVSGIRDIVENGDASLLLETSAPRNWSEFYTDDIIPTSYTPLQLSEYKLSEFEKDLTMEQQRSGRSRYTDNELFYTFRVEQMKKIISILKQKS